MGPGTDVDAPIGRHAEWAELEALWARASTGAAAVLLVGEPGIGKSTVWEAGVAAAAERGLPVVVARPAESEATLAFAALGDLLEPHLDCLRDALPAPQIRALEVALQRIDATEPADRLAVQRATHGVLRALATDGPLMVAIDDVQWLDNSSAAALAFALRRLRDAPVLVLAGLREPLTDAIDLEGAIPGRVNRVRLGPLGEAHLLEVVHQRLGVVVPPPTMRRVCDISAGNAFYALELVRGLPARRGRVTAERVEVTGSLLDLVGARLRALPERVRDAVTASGALAVPTIPVLTQLDAHATDSLRAAEEAGVVVLDGDRVRVTHPLLASAALALLSPSRRLALHRRLAQVAPSDHERALHLALGAAAPDEPDAAVLEHAAAGAAMRGAPYSAGELAEHAARLTPETGLVARRRRLRIAAGHYLIAGEVERGRGILEQLIGELPAGPERASALVLLADVEPDLADGMRRCEQAATEAAEDDACRAEALRLSSEFTMLRGDVPEALELARRASALAERTGDDILLVRCLGTQSHFETYQGQITPGLLERAVALEDATPGTGGHYSPTQIMGLRLMYADRLDEARALLERILEHTEEFGDDLERMNLLVHLTQLEIRAGRWARARELADVARALDRQVGVQPEPRLFLTALVAAHLGREDDVRAAARAALTSEDEDSHALWVLMARWALGLLELSLGDTAAAALQLAPLPDRLAASGYRNPGVRPMLPDAIEALVAVGRTDEAARWTDELRARGQELENPWAIATGLRCAGLVAEARGRVAEATACLNDALIAHERSPNRFERARTLLAFGVVQRRAKQWRAARTTLTEALETFDQLGAALWSERAATELARIQGRRRADGLTATERRVAELVSGGCSNKEVAAQLHVSVRAVEANLSRIYAKLGVRSRTELAGRVHDSGASSDG